MGIFGSFSKAKQTVADAKKDVRRPKDQVSDRRQQNQKKQGGGKK